MENASKALLIAGAILLCILIIAIGMFIYNNAQGTIVSSLNSLSTQEVESFNNQFMTYQGVQKGTNVKRLLEKLISNANTYGDDYNIRIPPDKIPWVYSSIPGKSGSTIKTAKWSTTGKIGYIDRCTGIKNSIKAIHEYYVYFTYQSNGLIDYICILYDITTDFSEDVEKKTREPK